MDDKEKPNFNFLVARVEEAQGAENRALRAAEAIERREPGYWHGNLLRNHRDADVYWVEALVELFRA